MFENLKCWYLDLKETVLQKLEDIKRAKNMRKTLDFIDAIAGSGHHIKADIKEADFGWIYIVEYVDGSGYTFFINHDDKLFDYVEIPRRNNEQIYDAM